MKKSFLFCLLVALLIPWATTQAEELTVNDGTSTNLYVPIYGYYADTSGKSQFIVPSGDASAMAGGTISGLSFYASSDFAFTAIWEVRLLETDETSVSSSFVDVSSASLVYTGTIPISGGIASITFDEAFEYGGDNLLIEISLKTTGNCSTSSSPLWYGVSTGTSRGGSGYSPESRNFLPKTTFTYEPAAAGGCGKPQNLVTDGEITKEEVWLTWNIVEGADGYQLEYSKNSDFSDPLAPVEIDDYLDGEHYYAILANLEAATTYYAHVRSICGGETSNWSSKISFTIPCDIVSSYPWSINFDDITAGNGVLPMCWSKINTSTSYGSYPYVYNSSSSAHSGNNSLYFYTYSYNGADQYAILPQMNDLSGKRIVFWAKGYNASSKIIVGEIANPTDAESFSVIEEISLTTSYRKYAVILNGNHPYIALKVPMSSSSYSYTGAYIDDIKVENVPSCLEISDLSLVSSATNSAILNWNASESGETAWDIYYSTENVAPTAGTVPSIAATSAKEIPSGLNAASTYYVWVRAHCSDTDQGAWSEGISFETKCEAVTAFPWSENFNEREAGNIDFVCWKNEHISGGGSYIFKVAAGSSTSDATTNVGQLPDMTSGTITDLTLPDMNIPTANAYEFIISVYRNATGSSYTQEGLRILAVQGENSTDLGFISRNYTQSNTNVPAEEAKGWYTYNFTIPYSGNMNIVVRGESKYGSATYFDDLKVREIPSCIIPASIADPTNITASSATFSWVAGNGETDFQYVVVPAGQEPTWDAPTDVPGANSAVVGGLSANTAYDFYVRANCGADQSEARSISFRTACTPYDAASWADSFEEGIYCWTVGNRQSTSADYTPSVASSYYAKTGEHALKLNAYKYAYYSTTTNADSAYAILPEMTFGEGGISKYTLALSARAGGSDSYYNKHLYVCVGSDPSDIRTFTVVGDIETTTTYADYEIDLAGYTGEGQRIALLAVIPSGTNYSLYGQFYVDDMRTFRTPTCQPLASIAVSDLSRRSMIVNLTPKSGLDLANAHELVYSTSELEEAALEAADKIAINDTNKYEISGLDRETLYYIYVRANCGNEDGKSAWVSTSAKTKGLNYIEELIVADGTTDCSYAPVHGINADSKQRVQSIYPATLLTDLQGKTISKLSYSIKSASAKDSWRKGSMPFDVRMGITASEDLSSGWASEDLTLVYSGVLDASGTSMDIELATPFEYAGGNLVVEFKLHTATVWESASFNGIAQTGGSRYAEGDTYATAAGSVSNLLPRVAFGYNVALDACPAVTELNASVLGSGTTQEKISWAISDADYLSGFDMIVSEVELDADALATAELTYSNIQGLSKDLDGLNPATDYYVYLRAICKAESHDEGTSGWTSVQFKTLADCPAVINLALALGATDSITATWERATLEQAKEFKYILSDVRLDEAALAASTPSAVNDTVIGFNALDHEKKYYFYVASACGEAVSAYVEDSIETLPACQKVENLAAARVAHNLVELTWNSAQFASETQWKVGIVDDPVPAQIVSERHAILFGLNAESAYEAYVIALCDGESLSDSVKVAFNTAEQPGACQQVGQGTSNGNMPVTNYDYAYTQMIYGANLIGQSGNITSLQLMRSSYTNVMNNMKVYLGTTDKATFASSSDWIAAEDLTLVYEGSFPAGTADAKDLVLELIQPFAYNGSENLVVAISNGNGNWNSIQNFYYTTASNTVLCRREDDTPSYAEHPGTAAGQAPSSYRTNIQFCFEPKACPDVKALAISDITTSSAKASWEPMGSEVAWNVFISNAVVTDFSDPTAYNVERVSELHKNFTGLLDDTDYFVYVQPADCEGADFVGTNFRTIASCLKQNAPAVVAESITAHTAIVKWVDPNAVKAGQYTIAYAKADKFDLENPLIATVQANDTFASLTALQADTVYKFAVKADCGETGASRWSDVAQFSTLESCFTPTSPVVVADSITAHSATVAWTDAHDDAGYIVAYGPYAAFDISDPATYEIKNVTTDTFALLDGLNAATKYAFCVKGDCESEGLSKNWTNVVPFTTECEAISVVGGWNEDFNAYSGATSTSAPSAYPNDELPICWSFLNRSTTSSTYPQVFISSNSGYNVSGNSLFFKSAASSAIYAILPQFVEEISTLQLTFTYRNEGNTTSNGTLHVGYMTDPSDAATFVSVLDCEQTTTLTEQEVLFSGAPSGSYMAFQYMGGSSQNYYLSIDNVMVGLIPTCARPNALAVSNITANSAQLIWTEKGEATSWQIRLNGDDEHLIDADANPFNLSDLTAATAYSAEVRANCGGSQSDWSAPLAFTTELCNEADKKAITFVLTDQYSDSWNGNSIKIIHKNTSVEVATITMSASTESLEGSVNLCCGEEYSFVWVTGQYASECGYVFYDINGEEILSKETGSTAPSAGEFFTYTMNCVVPTCIKPASVEVSAITTSSATFNWVAGNSETDFQYVVVAKDEAPDWSAATDVNGETTALVESLNANTAYDFYVRANCGEEKSDPRKISFRTDCGVMALPFQEFFEDEIPCWTMKDCASNTNVSADAKFEGEKGFKFYYNTNPPQYLISPEFIASEKKVEVSFYYKAGSTYGTETFKVGYSSSTNDATSFIWSEEFTAENTWELYKDTLEAGVKYVAIQYTANNEYYLYIDNFAVEEINNIPTGFDAIESKNAAIKRLENDQVVIIRDGKKYTIMGVKIQ